MDTLNLELLNYNLNLQGDAKVGDEQYRDLVLRTLIRLPEKIREKILEETLFIIATPGVYGIVFDLNFKKAKNLHCILLNFSTMHKTSDSGKMDTIAHEIAHVILNHGSWGNPQQEKEADDLIQGWGFQRAREVTTA